MCLLPVSVPLPPPAPLARQPMAALSMQQQKTAPRVPLAAAATVPALPASPDLSTRPTVNAATPASNAGKRTVPITDVNAAPRTSNTGPPARQPVSHGAIDNRECPALPLPRR